MTTVAIGSCTSAPVPVASAIGTKPREATSTVMTTGRNRVSAPSRRHYENAQRVPSSCCLLARRIDGIAKQALTRTMAARPPELFSQWTSIVAETINAPKSRNFSCGFKSEDF
jgi:hypothetical protein